MRDYLKKNKNFVNFYNLYLINFPFKFFQTINKYINAYINKIKFNNNLLLNIGAGPGVKVNGWLIVDYSKSGWAIFKKNSIDINYNLANGIPLLKNSVNAIYASHFLEHFTWNEGRNFLDECYRVLNKDGKIRIAVPNGDYFITKFIERDNTFFNNPDICYNHWVGNLTDTFLWNFMGATSTNSRNFGRHSMFYNEENLTARLSNAGFIDIKVSKFNESSYEFFEDELKFFPNATLPRETDFGTLTIEAVK